MDRIILTVDIMVPTSRAWTGFFCQLILSYLQPTSRVDLIATSPKILCHRHPYCCVTFQFHPGVAGGQYSYGETTWVVVQSQHNCCWP